jgi:UDP-N-acetylmuramoyl-tripeptide--D-alanyl-D-alanine ligase
MGVLTIKEVIEATGGRVIYGNSVTSVFTGVSIDSRTIREGELFIALRGERFDGHAFLTDAMKKGKAAIVSTPPAVPVKGTAVIYVKNTLKALQDIAHHVRMRGKVTVVGITGTNGKTTTKELISSILGKRHRVMKTSGNLNNHIGLPLSLIRLDESDEFAVMEMGASVKGDIQQLCDIASPDYGVITNIGPGHLEGFGSLGRVRSTKLELFDAVKSIVVNADDRFLMEGVAERSGKGRPDIITFGMNNPSDVSARDIILEERRSVFTLCLANGECTRVVLNLNGTFNIANALAASAICSAMGAGAEEIKAGIESFRGVPMRLEFKEFFGATVISDVYNANPASMEEAMKELVRLRKKRTIAVLGDMLELGAYAEDAHRNLGKWMSEIPVDVFIAVGPLMAKTAEEFRAARRGHSPEGHSSPENGASPSIIVATDASDARRILLEICDEGDTVLVKGSRGMSMERVLEEDQTNMPDHQGKREVGNAL